MSSLCRRSRLSPSLCLSDRAPPPLSPRYLYLLAFLSGALVPLWHFVRPYLSVCLFLSIFHCHRAHNERHSELELCNQAGYNSSPGKRKFRSSRQRVSHNDAAPTYCRPAHKRSSGTAKRLASPAPSPCRHHRPVAVAAGRVVRGALRRVPPGRKHCPAERPQRARRPIKSIAAVPSIFVSDPPRERLVVVCLSSCRCSSSCCCCCRSASSSSPRCSSTPLWRRLERDGLSECGFSTQAVLVPPRGIQMTRPASMLAAREDLPDGLVRVVVAAAAATTTTRVVR